MKDVFSETSRVIKPGGIFGFDIYEYDAKKKRGYEKFQDGIYTYYDDEYGHQLFRHSQDYIFNLLSDTGFEPAGDTEFLVSKERDCHFRTITARRSLD